MQELFYNSILDVIGHTPIVRLNRFPLKQGIDIFAKLEFLNPMGSCKDRIAKFMIEKAEKDGRIKPGDLIIENSSGNTALGLALIAIQKGYRLKVIVRDRISREKIDQLRTLGVDVQLVDSSLPPEHPDSYNNITPRLARETPGCYFPDQHNNRENNEAHYQTTGPEIWAQMEEKIDFFIAGMGTGGTIGGAGRYLKEKNPRIKVIGVDPKGSIFYDYFHSGAKTTPTPYLLEGLGDEFIINTVEFDILDDLLRVTDRDAFHMTRKLLKTEGIMAGGSSGAVLCAALRLAESLQGPARIVTIFPDSASRYLSTIFNDAWMAEKELI